MSLNCEVFSVSLDGQGGCSPTEKTDSNSPQWLHGDFSHPDCEKWLHSLNVPDSVIETMVRPESRPRAYSHSLGFMLNLRAININPGKDPEDMVSIRLWIEKSRLISVRQRKIYSVQGVRDLLDQQKGPNDISDLLSTIVEKIADRISEFVDDIEDQLNTFEENIDSNSPETTRAAISQLRRQAITVKRYLAPQREALESFYYLAKGEYSEANLHTIKEQSDRIIRYLEDLDLVREKTQVLQEELMNKLAQEQNSRMFVLSIVAAIFLPLSFITGLFGMNVGGLPWLGHKLGFIFVVAFMLIVSIGSILYFRYKRWL